MRCNSNDGLCGVTTTASDDRGKGVQVHDHDGDRLLRHEDVQPLPPDRGEEGEILMCHVMSRHVMLCHMMEWNVSCVMTWNV